jgi:hypothetical protein
MEMQKRERSEDDRERDAVPCGAAMHLGKVSASTIARMLSFVPELERLRSLLGSTTTDALVARERREVFSVHPELRVIGWAGAMLLATAGGLVLKNNLDRIGPLALASLMGLAAAGCYAFVWWRRRAPSLVEDYVLLLGALLISADVAFIESQFHLLGDAWHRHFLILAVWHAATAYLLRSRVVLSLSIAAVAAWLGVRDEPFGRAREYAMRALACAMLVVTWREAQRRLGAHAEFLPTFEHFAANIAFAGAIALMFDRNLIILGCLLMLALAAIVIAWGVHTRRETFLLYGFLYAVLAIDVLFAKLVNEEALVFFFVVLSIIGAIVALFTIHARVREWRT